ncbi:zinc-binding alcohol dehydrogenase [Cohnella sp. REN36]|uniref:zinc-dependent alcohol dehydrogenase n=1 Tax=Cohnella sp. REN36 TaxID=2887347 RepID=UPI001D137273|nr:zinc-binding alcohol dehydrogenase [Cohnella sp. REN36]MCC3372322.1 zinc-binding alcohol dehydrogenase [Cohnella sp. REN36]
MKIFEYTAPKTLIVKEIQDIGEIGEQDVRIETIISGISHGTEMNIYRGVAPFFNRKFDPATRLFVPAGQTEVWTYPVKSSDPGVWYMGYANVGKITEIGRQVKNLQPGDIVYSHSPHQSQVIRRGEDVVRLPNSVKPESGIFFNLLMTAYNGILDSEIKLGDTVVVSGLGVLGQLVAQLAKLSGAGQVIGIDLHDSRLNAALENGIDAVFNATHRQDTAYEIRQRTRNKGADVVIEVTGNHRALNEAIRIAAPDTTVTALGWYQGPGTALELSEEFHHNRIRIRSSHTARTSPSINHMWNSERKRDQGLELLEKLRLENLITHKIRFDDIALAYETIDQRPETVIQIALTY